MSATPSVSISRRLSYGLTTVIVLSLALVVTLIAVAAQRSGEANLHDETTKSAERLAEMLATPLWDLDLDRVVQLSEAFASDKRVVSITIREPVSGVVRTVRRSYTTDTIFVKSTATHDGRTVGEVGLAFDRGLYRAQIVRDVRIALVVTFIALIASLIGVRVLLRRLLEKPLVELSAVVENYAAGDYTSRNRVVGYGELDTFSTVLAGMGDRIVKQLSELQQGNTRLAREIQSREEAEEELHLLGAALAAAANGIVITNRDGAIVWTNAAFSECTGYSRDEAVGRTPGELLKSGKHDRAFSERLWKTILSGEVWHGEMVNRRKDGTLFSEDMTITPLKSDAGRITHFIAVKQDITQRKSLEEQFRQAQKMDSIGRLAGGVAHDFNNQLGVIIGHAEMAMQGTEAATTLHEDLTEIHRAALRSADLTRQMLTFARKQEIAPSVLDLNERVAHSLKMLQRLIGEHIQMSWQPAAELWPVLMDTSQVDQVLANLCVNARDAIANVGRVRLSTANCVLDAAFCAVHPEVAEGDYVRLSVSDDGCGMTPEIMARIFEPFFTTKGVGEGTGLGLATVYGAVRQNYGCVDVSSVPLEGTTFDIYLPRFRGAVAPVELPATQVMAPSGRETVLLVEDDPGVLRMATKALEAHGYTVRMASGPGEALRVASTSDVRIDLLLTDVVMPDMNGRELADQLAAARPELKLLFMSGFAGHASAGTATIAQSGHFIAKPFSVSALAVKVRQVLDEA